MEPKTRLLCGVLEPLPCFVDWRPMPESEISSDEEVEKMEEDDDELVYNPDQNPEEVRKVRANYRELVREQDGTE